MSSTTDDDPLARCRRDPEAVRELQRRAEAAGKDAFAAACADVLERIGGEE